jgi:hypothetical protein
MTLQDVVKTALGNLTRHKARTALTTIGVIVGILTIVTMVSLGHGVQREMHRAFDRGAGQRVAGARRRRGDHPLSQPAQRDSDDPPA